MKYITPIAGQQNVNINWGKKTNFLSDLHSTGNWNIRRYNMCKHFIFLKFKQKTKLNFQGFKFYPTLIRSITTIKFPITLSSLKMGHISRISFQILSSILADSIISTIFPPLVTSSSNTNTAIFLWHHSFVSWGKWKKKIQNFQQGNCF